MDCLNVLPVASDLRDAKNHCAQLILAAEIECSAFMCATKQLFGEDMTLRAGGPLGESARGRFWFSMPAFRSAAGNDLRGL